jgi:PAS domain S-box-containing protein
MTKSKKPSYEELEQRIRELENNILESKQMEKCATLEQSDFEILFINAPFVMLIVDRNRRVVRLNRSAVAMTRRPEQESIGLRGGEALRCVHAADDPKGCGFSAACESCIIRNAVLDTFRTGKSYRTVEALIPYDSEKGPADIWVHIFTSLLDLPAGKSVLVCLEDITEKKSAERALKQSELKFRFVTETIEEVFWMSTRGVGKIIYVSPAYETLWQKSTTSLYQSPRSFIESIHPGDLSNYLAIIKKCHAKGKPYQCEYRIIRKDAQVRWIHERGYPVPQAWEGDRLMTGVCTDITERKRAEEGLQQSLRELEVREKITKLFLTAPKGRIFSGIVHLLLDEFSSTYGYIGYIDENGDLICPSMTGNIWQECRIPGKSMIFPKQCWAGIWGESLKNRRSIIRNEDLRFPKGHVPINNALVVPLIVGKELIGQMAVANKATVYTLNDQIQMESLSKFISPILKIFFDKEKAQDKLRSYAKRIEEKNTALNVLLENREKEKEQTSDSILRSFEKLVFPYFKKLKTCRNKEDIGTILTIVEQHTMESLSPLEKSLPSSYSILTPMEIQVADLIKAGKYSKEIAEMLNISPRSVFFHRNNIRKKLNIHNKKSNLRSILLTLSK